MKKPLVLLPLLGLVLITGVAFSKPEPPEREKSHDLEKQILEHFPHGGMRLGVVLSGDDPEKSGVHVDRVVPDSPADHAGLEPGDTIISLDGTQVSSARDIRDFLNNLEDTREIEMQIERDGKPITLKVKPEKRDLMSLAFPGRMYLGLNLQELDPDLSSYFQVNAGSGALVTRVEPDSPAARAGIRSGDVITHVDGAKVNEPNDVISKLGGLQEGESLELTVLRHGSEQKVSVKPEKRNDWPGMHMREMPDLRMLQSPEFKNDMENLRREMDKLRNELQLRDEDLQKMKDEIRDQVRREMEKLRSELKQHDNES